MKLSGLHRLPRDPHERAAELVRRAAPDPSLPHLELPEDVTRMRRESANMRASMYAQLEDSSDDLIRLAEVLDNSGVVIDMMDADDDDSLVVAISNAAGR